MRFSLLTRAVDRIAAACSLQTQAGAPAGQAAQSAVQRSPPSVTHIMDYYSFNRSQRDGRLSWPCWLTDSGRRTHKVVKQPSISLAQDRESPLAGTDVITTMLHHQLTAPVETIKLVPMTHYDVRHYITTSKEHLINCYILLQYFELVFLQLQLLKILCKLIII